MIDVSELLADPDFCEAFTIMRSTGGSFGPSGWMDNTTAVPSYGSIQPASDKDLRMVPEGDRVSGSLAIYSQQELFVTHNDPQPGISDIVICRGENYRVQAVKPWVDFGYFVAIAVRMKGD